jgi:hypothetical protein
MELPELSPKDSKIFIKKLSCSIISDCDIFERVILGGIICIIVIWSVLSVLWVERGGTRGLTMAFLADSNLTENW